MLYESASEKSSNCFAAIIRYAKTGSRTCWYGRVETGLRRIMVSLNDTGVREVSSADDVTCPSSGYGHHVLQETILVAGCD